MAVIGMDLGGTKLATAVFSERGKIITKSHVPIGARGGEEVGRLICEEALHQLELTSGVETLRSIGVCVPGIYYARTGRVWAPNIPGWDDYPLLEELTEAVGDDVTVRVDSDRSCAILGEVWRGVARGCRNAIFIAIGTGIGAGILVDGRVLRGHSDIGGAVGWFGLQMPYREEYAGCGDFEYNASGAGLVRVARELLDEKRDVDSIMRQRPSDELNTQDVFAAHAAGDPIAVEVIDNAIRYWGMAVANLVSIFNPQKVIFGGGVFGPAAAFLERISEEARKWAQPISFSQVTLEVSKLGFDAQLYGAGRLALKRSRKKERPVEAR